MTKTIAFVAFPRLTLLDLVGPLQVLKYFSQVETSYETKVVGENLEPIATDTGLRIVPEANFWEVKSPFVVIVPGGRGARDAMKDQKILDYVRSSAEKAEIVGSVCTGALVLAAAGLLEGRMATTFWGAVDELENLGAKYLRKRWVEDGKFITAAGVSAGIDMALALVAKLADEQVSRLVQIHVEYDPQPPFGRMDWTLVDKVQRNRIQRDPVCQKIIDIDQTALSSDYGTRAFHFCSSSCKAEFDRNPRGYANTLTSV